LDGEGRQEKLQGLSEKMDDEVLAKWGGLRKEGLILSDYSVPAGKK
jgi:hypothetical protein